MVVAGRRQSRSRSAPAASTLVLSIETKCILLTDRTGTPTSSMAPVLRVGFVASAVTVDDRGEVHGVISAPITVDPGTATQHLANLALTQTTMRGPLQVVGLIGDDNSAEIVRGALRQLRTSGECTRWTEVLDPALLRGRLARILAVLERSDAVRDELLGGWDLALTFEPGAIDDVIGALRRRTARLADAQLAAAEALLEFLRRHRSRADYGTLRKDGIEIPMPTRRHLYEHLPLRMNRARCRPVTSW